MRSLDLRLLPIAVGLWVSEALTIWLASAGSSGIAVTGLFSGAAAICTVGFLRPRAEQLSWFAVGLAVAVGVVLASLRLVPLVSEPLASMGQQRAVVVAHIVVKTPPKYSASNVLAGVDKADAQPQLSWYSRADLISTVEGDVTTSLNAPVLVTGMTSGRALTELLIPGSTIRLKASVQPGEVMRGTAAVLRVTGDPIMIAAAPSWQQGAHYVRKSLSRAADGLASDPRGLLPGIVAGDESNVPQDLREQMQAVGLSHLTAVSGANLAIVAGAVLLLARLLRVSRRLSVVAGAVAMFGFVIVAGFQPSVLRAAFMGSVALLALFSSRRKAGISALAASAFLLLLIDPWMSISLGFALSVAATGGLLIYARSILEARQQRSGLPWVRFITVQALGVAAAAQLATMPLIAAIGGGVPLIGVAANVLAAPAVPFATILGAMSATSATVSPEVGRWFAVAGGYPTGWIASTARWSYDVPFARIEWPDGIFGFVSVASVTLLLVLGWRYHAIIRTWCRPILTPNRRPVVLVGASTLVVLLLWVGPATDGWPAPEWVAVACDVGQGDAVVIRTGEGSAILVDVGPEPTPVDRCLRSLDISTIDLLVLSHFHLDHVGGLAGALDGRRVARVLVSPLPEPTAQTGFVLATLRDSGLTAEVARPGEQGTIGAATYRILWPKDIIREPGSAPNNASVTMVVDVGGVGILLTGDLEPPAQQAVIASEQGAGIDVVKVPHHGSRNQAGGFVPWVGEPAVALISVGADNSYGHPAAETTRSWSDVGAQIARTDEGGDIVIVPDAGKGAVAIPRAGRP
jgi:competence protein ComEC